MKNIITHLSLKGRIFLAALVATLALSVPAMAQLSGSYTIDASLSASKTNYKTFSALARDLNVGKRTDGGTPSGPGVSGPVTVKVANGTYNEQVRFGDVIGVSPSSPVIIQSASGDSSKVVLKSAASSVLNNLHTLLLDSTDYFTFKQISIEKFGPNPYGVPVIIQGEANSNTFKGCRLMGVKTNQSLNGQSVIFAGNGFINDSNSFIGNYIANGSVGINYLGISNSAKSTGIIIKNNVVDSSHAGNIRVQNVVGLDISGNVITNEGYIFSYGVWANFIDYPIKISANKIEMDSGAYGLYLNQLLGDVADPAIVSNNFITVRGENGCYGLFLNGSDMVNTVYNNVLVDNAGSPTVGAYFNGTFPASNVVLNNIFTNFGTGYAIAIGGEDDYVDTYDYNDLFTLGNFVGFDTGYAYTTLNVWHTFTLHDSFSVNLFPFYKATNSKDLHVSNSGLNAVATPLTYVTTDIDGAKRDATKPDIGADEFTPPAIDVSLFGRTGPANGACGDVNLTISLAVTNFGSTTVTKIPVTVEMISPTTGTYKDTLRGILKPGDLKAMDVVTNFNTAAGGTFTFKVYTSLAGDADVSNDTLKFTVTLVKAAVPPTSVTGATACGYHQLSLKAAAPGTGYGNIWFSDPLGDTVVAIGDTFQTPYTSLSHTYYVGTYAKSIFKTGKINYFPTNTAALYPYSASLVFDALSDFTLDSVTIYPEKTGWVVLNLKDATGKAIAHDSERIVITTIGERHRIAVGFNIRKGLNYTIDADNSTTALVRNSSGAKFPYVIPNVLNLKNTGNGLGVFGYYYFFYDWQVSGVGCVSKLVPVNATITKAGTSKVMFRDLPGCIGNTTLFRDSSAPIGSNIIHDWHLVFGDGTKDYYSKVSGGAVHFYNFVGGYRAIMTVTTNNSCSDTASRIVNIDPLPKAAFSSMAICAGMPSYFYNEGTPLINGRYWRYYFGDGTDSISYSGNATHVYKKAGTYTVRLISVTKGGCVDSTKAVIVIKTPPADPVTTDVVKCGAQAITLTASTPPAGYTNLWYPSFKSDSIIFRGNSYTTPVLSADKTYYVQATNEFPDHAGEVENSFSTGAIVATDKAFGLVFDVYKPFTLDSVTIYPYSSGKVRINWTDSLGNIYDSSVSYIKVKNPGDAIKVRVGFHIPVGTKFALHAEGSATGGLFRNDGGAAFPYDIPGILSIHNTISNEQALGYYYFFYNWRITYGGCSSKRVPVTAFVGTGTKPTADFSASLSCTNTGTKFTDNSTGAIASYNYAWGDTTKDYYSTNTGNTSHVFKNTNTYSVTLTVRGPGGCLDKISKNVTVYKNAKADFLAQSKCQGAAIPLVNSSFNPGGGSLTYKWDFADGDTTGSTQKDPIKRYKKSGAFRMLLSAKNAFGCTDTISHLVDVYPVPSIKRNYPANACSGSTVNFYDSSTIASGSIASRLWDFGDGNTDNKAVTSHKYSLAAKKNVVLSVTSDKGCNWKDTGVITLKSGPYVNFTYSGKGKTYVFKVADSITSTTYVWDFGDTSATSSSFTAVHTYKHDGQFKVSLTGSKNTCVTELDTIITLKTNAINEGDEEAFGISVSPNPFHEFTTISYKLAHPAQVTAQVMDATGRIIATLTEGRQMDGRHELRFDPQTYQAAAGVYMLRMTVNGQTINYRMVNVR